MYIVFTAARRGQCSANQLLIVVRKAWGFLEGRAGRSCTPSEHYLELPGAAAGGGAGTSCTNTLEEVEGFSGQGKGNCARARQEVYGKVKSAMDGRTGVG